MAGLSSPIVLCAACALPFIIACSTGSSGQPTGAPTDGSLGAGGAEAGPVDDPDPVITGEARTALEALRYDAGPPPADPSNRVADHAGARTFGQRLFFDPSMSGRLLEPDNDGSASTLGKVGEAGRVSCAGCHLPAGFVDTRSPHQQISLAAQWTIRRTPTLLDVSFFPLYNWDGRRDSIWGQAIGVMESSVEFNSSRLFVAEQIFRFHRAEYETIFGAMPPLDDAQRFPQLDALQAGCDPGPAATARCRGKPGDKADYDGMAANDQVAVTTVTVNAAKAIAAYVRALRCGPGRFDQWLDGDASALNRSEQRGAALFVGAGKCVSCHSGPHFADGKFHNVGLRPGTVAVAFTDTGDRGAGEGLALALNDPLNSKGTFSDGDRGVLPAAVGAEFEGAFKTPTLRCIADHPSFMHTGHLTSLELVVRFFNRGGDPAGFPGTNEIGPLGLSDREQADLVAFIGALQGAGAETTLLAPPAN
jgi:cytochrome c peroxidase